MYTWEVGRRPRGRLHIITSGLSYLFGRHSPYISMGYWIGVDGDSISYCILLYKECMGLLWGEGYRGLFLMPTAKCNVLNYSLCSQPSQLFYST